MVTPLIAHKTQLPSRRLLSLALFLIPFGLFGITLSFQFLEWGDAQHVTRNPEVLKGLSLRGFWYAFSNLDSGAWIPVTWLSHMIDVSLYGLHPGGHHLTNILLHCINTLLIFWMFQRLIFNRLQSFFIALFFAIHPLSIEPVAWISDRQGLLAVTFACISMGSYIHYAAKPAWSRMLLAAVTYILSLLSSPLCLFLPLLFLLLDIWPLCRLRPGMIRLVLKEKLVFWIIAGAFTILLFVHGLQNETLQKTLEKPWPLSLQQLLLAYNQSLLDWLIPYPLEIFKSPFPEIHSAGNFITQLIGLLAFALFCFVFGFRAPALWMGGLWFVLMILPMPLLIQPGIEPFSNRLLYFPRIGLFWILSEILCQPSIFPSTFRNLRTTLLTGCTLLLMLLTTLQLMPWESSFTILENNQDKKNTPQSLVQYGNLHMQQGDTYEATRYFKKALEMQPDLAEAHVRLGVLLEEKGETAQALDHFLTALSLNPEHPVARINYANILFFKKQWVKALSEYQRTLAVQPGLEDAHLNLAITYCMLGDFAQARAGLLQALLEHPQLYPLGLEFGKFLEAQKKFTDAKSFYSELGTLYPGREALKTRLDSLREVNSAELP